MNKSDFFYDLPQELIAQFPCDKRDNSKMMVLNPNGELEHKHFFDIIDYLNENDCLILNDTKVFPARLFGTKNETGAEVEFLLLKNKNNNTWESLAKPGKKAKIGDVFSFGDKMTCEIIDILDSGNRIINFSFEGNFYEILDQIGNTPLPPYITKKLDDPNKSQTVYAKNIGSAAAPTAGFHFTEDLIQKIKNKGIKIGYVTLHVGLGTFRPVKVEDIKDHKMHTESYYMPDQTAQLINDTKKSGGRVICVGTTSCRTVETVAQKGLIEEQGGNTDIFIYPGYKFKCMDALITNFHLPESTLIMLVSAFAGYENTMNAYKEAVKEKYRFFSFGDCMFITGKVE